MELTLPESEWLKDGGKSRLGRSPSTPMPYALVGWPRDTKQRSNSSPLSQQAPASHIMTTPHVEAKDITLPTTGGSQALSTSTKPASTRATGLSRASAMTDILNRGPTEPTTMDDLIINGQSQPVLMSAQYSGQLPLCGAGHSSQDDDMTLSSVSESTQGTGNTGATTTDIPAAVRVNPGESDSSHKTKNVTHANTHVGRNAPPLVDAASTGANLGMTDTDIDSIDFEAAVIASAANDGVTVLEAKHLQDTAHSYAAEGPTQDSSGTMDSASSSQSSLMPEVKILTAQQKRLRDMNNRNINLQGTLNELASERNQLAAQLRDLTSRSKKLEESHSGLADSGQLSQDQFDEVMGVAKATIKEHISLLHRYNDIRDVAQGLMGMIAEQRAVRIRDVQEEFGIDQKD